MIPGLGRSPGEGKRYLLQYSCLKNPMNCIVHAVTKSRTRLSVFHFHFRKVQGIFMSYLRPRLWFEPGTDVTLPFSPSMGPVLSWQLSMVLVLVNASLSMLIHYNECIMRLKLYWKSNLPSWALLVLIHVLFFFSLCSFLLKLENCSVVSLSLQPHGL